MEAKSKVRLFSNKDLFYLFLPLIIEQLLEFVTGLADSIMVSYVGEAAVSGVSLVDFIMQFLISLFAALATGGAVVAGQYLGNRQKDEAKEAANQLVWFAGAFSLVVMVLVYLFQRPIFRILFGQIEADVYGNSYSYMMVVAASIPFLAIYNVGAAVFRTQGNSKLPMQIMFAMKGKKVRFMPHVTIHTVPGHSEEAKRVLSEKICRTVSQEFEVEEADWRPFIRTVSPETFYIKPTYLPEYQK